MTKNTITNHSTTDDIRGLAEQAAERLARDGGSEARSVPVVVNLRSDNQHRMTRQFNDLAESLVRELTQTALEAGKPAVRLLPNREVGGAVREAIVGQLSQHQLGIDQIREPLAGSASQINPSASRLLAIGVRDQVERLFVESISGGCPWRIEVPVAKSGTLMETAWWDTLRSMVERYLENQGQTEAELCWLAHPDTYKELLDHGAEQHQHLLDPLHLGGVLIGFNQHLASVRHQQPGQLLMGPWRNGYEVVIGPEITFQAVASPHGRTIAIRFEAIVEIVGDLLTGPTSVVQYDLTP